MKTFNDFLREADDLDIKINVEGKNYLIEQLAENLALVVKKRKIKPLRITTITGYINKEFFSHKGYIYETYLQVTLSNKDVITGQYNTKTNNIYVKINEEDVYDLIDKTFDNEVLVDKMVEKYKIHLRSNKFSINESVDEHEVDLYKLIKTHDNAIDIENKIKDLVLNKKVIFYHLEEDDSIEEIEAIITKVEYNNKEVYFFDKNNKSYYVDFYGPIIITEYNPYPKIKWFKKGKWKKDILNENKSETVIELLSIIEDVEMTDYLVEEEKKSIIEDRVKELVLGKSIICWYSDYKNINLPRKADMTVKDIKVNYDDGIIYFYDDNESYKIILNIPIIIKNNNPPKIRWFRNGKIER